jgi:hypothetical protein
MALTYIFCSSLHIHIHFIPAAAQPTRRSLTLEVAMKAAPSASKYAAGASTQCQQQQQQQQQGCIRAIDMARADAN